MDRRIILLNHLGKSLMVADFKERPSSSYSSSSPLKYYKDIHLRWLTLFYTTSGHQQNLSSSQIISSMPIKITIKPVVDVRLDYKLHFILSQVDNSFLLHPLQMKSNLILIQMRTVPPSPSPSRQPLGVQLTCEVATKYCNQLIRYKRVKSA